jgi:hypothetical protein
MTSPLLVPHFEYRHTPLSTIASASLPCNRAANSKHAMAMVGVLCLSGANVL